jgi:threonine dehydrogenase-like Zn-dependent dehydrogenase
MAARSAQLLAAERVVVIDRFDYRLVMAERELGVADPGDGPAARPAAGHQLLPKAGSVFVLGMFAGTVRGAPGIRPVQQQGRLRAVGVPA